MSQARRSTSKKQPKQAVEVSVEQLTSQEATVDRVAEVRAFWEENKDKMSKSAQIRLLTSKGYTRVEVSKGMGLLYQHVRNVLTTELKRPVTKAE